MTTLSDSSFLRVTDRLFALDDETVIAAAAAGLDEAEIMRLRASKTEYLDLYGRLGDAALAVSPQTARLLYMIARGAGSRYIVEFGASFGVSTLHLAAALRDNGGGRLLTTEFEPGKVKRLRENLEEAGLAEFVEIRIGDAVQTLSKDLPEKIDLLVLDGAKGLYPEILALIEPRLRPGALILADDADASPDYLKRVRSQECGYLSTPFGDDVELSLHLA